MLTDRAYLVVIDGDDEATFELRLNLEESSELSKSYVVGQRGQYVREISEINPFDVSLDSVGERRTGFWVDGGAGEWQHTLSFQTGLEDVQWGDGSDDDQKDASGEGVHPLRRKDVIEYWLANTRSDSGGQVRLHWSGWTSGDIPHVSGVSAGAYNRPMFVAIREANIDAPDPNEDVNSIEGTLTVNRVAPIPDAVPTDLEDAVDIVRNAFEGVIPDY